MIQGSLQPSLKSIRRAVHLSMTSAVAVNSTFLLKLTQVVNMVRNVSVVPEGTMNGRLMGTERQ